MSDAPLAIAELDALPLAAWWESRGIARATAFRLLKVAGITPGRMKVPSSRAPVSCLSAEQVQVLDGLAARLQAGATLPQLEAELTTAMVATTATPETGSDDPGHVGGVLDPGAVLARLEAAERAISSGCPLTTIEAAWILGAKPGGDRVVRAGIEAVRHARNCWQLRRAETV